MPGWAMLHYYTMSSAAGIRTLGITHGINQDLRRIYITVSIACFHDILFAVFWRAIGMPAGVVDLLSMFPARLTTVPLKYKLPSGVADVCLDNSQRL